MSFYGRKKELKVIEDFLNKKGSDIFFIKGRRRVGKSFLLGKVPSLIRNGNKNTISLMGTKKDVELECFQLMRKIEADLKDVKLHVSVTVSQSKKIDLDSFFERLHEIVSKRKTKTIIILDEIQWIGKDAGQSFSMKLKQYWPKLKETNKLKIIATGSSYRYFWDFLEEQDAPLRGMSSKETYEIMPFSLTELKKYYFKTKEYQPHHVVFMYMITGGVPQYLDWLESIENGFEYCVNKSFFMKGNGFLEEVNDLLTVEISPEKRASALIILKHLKSDDLKLGDLMMKIKSEPETISQPTVSRLLDDLIRLGFIGCKTLDGRLIKNPLLTEETHRRYYIKDLFLKFFFTLVYPEIGLINFNENDNIFGKMIQSNTLKNEGVPVVSHFTGKAFEQVIINVLMEKDLNLPIFKKISIIDSDFEVDTYDLKNKDQVDIFIKYKTFNRLKIIECKWINKLSKTPLKYCEEVEDKILNIPDKTGYVRDNCLVFSLALTTQQVKSFLKKNIVSLTHRDLFL